MKKAETYIPSKPCKRGHFERYVNGKHCVECAKSSRESSEEKTKAYRKVYYQENKVGECARVKTHYQENKEHFSSKNKLYHQENKETNNLRCKLNYQKNKERYKSNRQIFPKTEMLRRAKARAVRNGLEFNLIESDIIIPKYCPVFPEIELIHNEVRALDNSASLDRIDNTKGYVTDNIQVISKKANTLKNNSTIEDLERLLEYRKKTEWYY
jgi:hypothetical protein